MSSYHYLILVAYLVLKQKNYVNHLHTFTFIKNLGEQKMKEVVFENLTKVNLTKEELWDFFNLSEVESKDYSIYEKSKKEESRKQLDLFDLYRKDKYKKLYENKDGTLKKVERNKKNTVVKYSIETGEIEIAYYRKGFLVPKISIAEQEDVDAMKKIAMKQDIVYFNERTNGRNFKLNKETEEIEFVSESASIEKLVKSVRQGDVRAKKNFYDYALNNKWEYFCTFTFAEEKIRCDRNQIKTQWRYFIKELQKVNHDVKVLAVVEKHETLGFHLHALISDIDLILVPARNNKKTHKNYRDFLYNEKGVQIFNTKNWELGWNTVVCINSNSRQMQVINYLTKYVTKDPAALFGEKRFYRTYNYEVRNTEIMTCTEKQIEKLVKENGMTLFKKDEFNDVEYYQIKLKTAVPKTIVNNLSKEINSKYLQKTILNS